MDVFQALGNGLQVMRELLLKPFGSFLAKDFKVSNFYTVRT